MSKLYVQYGCGLSAPKDWINFDVSPTLRLQKIPVLGTVLSKRLSPVQFPSNVRYGNIISGLPVKNNSCDGIYCSHTLEHLALNDFEQSLLNTYKILKPGGVFRCVVPDLHVLVEEYMESFSNNNSDSSMDFMKNSFLGYENRPKGIVNKVKFIIGNSKHLWMWDKLSLYKALVDAGFNAVRVCNYNDSSDDMFKFVESADRFERAIAFECTK